MISFSHPVFLWGLVLMAIPVVLHLLNRHQNRHILFPTVQFLEKTALPREGRRRLQDLLLLLLRMLIPALAVLLAARPSWQSAPDSLPSTLRPELSLVLLDQSASMQSRSIRAAMQKILDTGFASSPETRWGLICYDRKPRLAVSPGRGKLPAILGYLKSDQAAPGYLEGNPGMALENAAAILKKFSGRKRLLILSDCQSSNWEKITASLPEDTEIRFFPELTLPSANAGIVQVVSAPLKDQRIRLSVLVRNYGSSPMQTGLSLQIGEQTQHRKITVPPDREIPAVFIFEQTGLRMRGTARLDEDDLPFDNSYEFWSGYPPPEKVLIVQEEMPEESRDALLENIFLTRALTTETEGRSPSYQPTAIPASTFFAVNYSGYRHIFLLGTAELLTPDDWDRLRIFVRRGGTLFITPGKAPQLAMHLLRQAGLVRARYLGIIGADSRQAGLGIGWVNPDSLPGRLFPEKALSDLYLFPIRRYVRLDFDEDKEQKILLQTLDGRPALLEANRGAGRIYVFASGFTPAWSDLVLTQSFLPLIRELCSGGRSRPSVSTRLVCGQPRPRFYQLNGEEIPGGEKIDSSRPGTSVLGEHLLEYHPDPRESETASSSQQALRRFLTRQPGEDTARKSRNLSAGLNDEESGLSLGPLLASMLAAILLLEGIVMLRSDRKNN